MVTEPEAWLREPAPLVIVEGFLCSTSTETWGQFADNVARGSRSAAAAAHSSARPRTVVLVPIGPLSSIHDRACELFHALRGSTVDYGHDHAVEHGHSRYGRRFTQPLLPGWGCKAEEQCQGRAHFLGHSLGGLTIVKMYDLLRSGFFDSHLGLTPSVTPSLASGLVLSLTTISSPHRGTPMVYLLGSQPTCVPLVRFLSVGDCLAKLVHLLLWARRLPLARNRFFDLDDWLPDFFADAWSFAGQGDGEEECGTEQGGDAKTLRPWRASEAFGLRSLLSQWNRSTWAEGRDCAPWDCTFAQREADEAVRGTIWSPPLAGPSPPVWLRSYAACVGGPVGQESGSKPARRSPTAWIDLLSHYDYSLSPPPGSRRRTAAHQHNDSGYTSASDDVAALEATGEHWKRVSIGTDWHRNDGIVPLASQYHPSDCRPGYCMHEEWVHECAELEQAASPPPLLSLATLVSAFRWLRPERPATAATATSATCLPIPPPPPSNVWHVSVLHHTTHAGLAPFYTGSHKQMAFWQHVGAWLEVVEQAVERSTYKPVEQATPPSLTFPGHEVE